MKDSLLVPQERNNYCVCSVLQKILGDYGVDFSQEEIANNLTKSRNGFRVNNENMRKFLGGNGLSYEHYWYDQTPLNDPDLVLFDMADHSGFVGIIDHVYLFQSYRGSKVELINPRNCEIVVYDVADMIHEMNKLESGCFGLIRN